MVGGHGAQARPTGRQLDALDPRLREGSGVAPGSCAEAAISKAVIESFAPDFLEKPAVLWLSESGNKVVARDDAIANAVGLHIEVDRNLPDIVLVDLGPDDPVIVFVEVVATDGPITSRRQEALRALTDGAGFGRSQIAVLTAYQDRDAPAFKRTVATLAWDSLPGLHRSPIA